VELDIDTTNQNWMSYNRWCTYDWGNPRQCWKGGPLMTPSYLANRDKTFFD